MAHEVMPAVSVIMPMFNQERYIGAAIESVRAQTLPDWELLIIDDGSVDASAAIAAEAAAADPVRIRLLRHPAGMHKGAAASRNLGIAEAKGEFLAFLDADDLYRPEKLAWETAALERAAGAAMLYSPTLWRFEDGSRRERMERLGVEPDRVHAAPELAQRVLFDRKGHVPCTCGVLLRRAAAQAIGGFEERFALYEDQSLWAKLFLRYDVYVCSRSNAIYRQHHASTSAEAQRSGQYHPAAPHPAHRTFLGWVEAYIHASGLNDERLLAALRRATFPYRHPWLDATKRLACRIGRRISRRVSGPVRNVLSKEGPV